MGSSRREVLETGSVLGGAKEELSKQLHGWAFYYSTVNELSGEGG